MLAHANDAVMNDGMIRLVIIGCYLLLLLGLGWVANRFFSGSKSDYQVASRSIGPFFLLMSLFGTTMTAFALVGSSGEAYKEGIGVYGMLASSSGIIHSLCFFLIGVKLWSFGKKYGYTTQIQFFRDRFESEGVGILLFPILVGLVIPYLLIGVMASGTVIQSLTQGAFPDVEAFKVLKNGAINKGLSGGLPPYIGSAVVCFVVLVYVFFGGMRGTAWANAFQTMVFMVLGVVTFYLLAMKLGGKETLMASMEEIMQKVVNKEGGDHKITRVGMSQTKFFTYMLIPLSVGMFPHLFQHWLTAKKASNFKLAVVCHPLFIMLVWIPCVMIGIWATSVPLPPGFDNPNAILPHLVKKNIAPVLGGFLAAGILAAIMSSLDSQFLCVGTIFSNDIAGRYFGTNKWSDGAQVWVSRSFILGIVAITYVLSLLGDKSVFTLAVWCFTGFSSLFPIVFSALYWKRVTKWGVMASVIATAGTWWYYFSLSKFGANRSFVVYVPGTDIDMMPVVPIFLASTAALVVVSLITPPPSEKTLSKFF